MLKTRCCRLFIAMLVGGATVASAAQAAPIVEDCAMAKIGIDSIVHTPQGEASRMYYENRVAIYKVDTVEPAASSIGVAIVLPKPQAEDELDGGFLCLAVTGFADLAVDKTRSAYDKNGLHLAIPTRAANYETGGMRAASDLKLTINVKSGSVRIEP